MIRHTKYVLVFFLTVIMTLLQLNPKDAFLAAENKPKTLMFSSIDIYYMSDHLQQLGGVMGINGVLLANIAEWHSSKKSMFAYRDVLKKVNLEGADYGVDSNFIKVALGYKKLPAWNDDKAWANVLNNVRNIAELIKETGTKGIAIDTEPYEALFDPDAARFKSINRDVLKAKIYQRGKEIMQALTEVHPGIEVIILPEGAFYWFNADEGSPRKYELWIDFFNGMASIKNKKGLIVASERTYSVTNKEFLKKIYDKINGTMQKNTQDAAFWNDKCSIALGMWPLGKTYTDQSARYSLSRFQEQFTAASELSPKYVWIYEAGAPWFPISKEDVEMYTTNGRWFWGKGRESLPMDPQLLNFYSVIKGKKTELIKKGR